VIYGCSVHVGKTYRADNGARVFCGGMPLGLWLPLKYSFNCTFYFSADWSGHPPPVVVDTAIVFQPGVFGDDIMHWSTGQVYAGHQFNIALSFKLNSNRTQLVGTLQVYRDGGILCSIPQTNHWPVNNAYDFAFSYGPVIPTGPLECAFASYNLTCKRWPDDTPPVYVPPRSH